MKEACWANKGEGRTYYLLLMLWWQLFLQPLSFASFLRQVHTASNLMIVCPNLDGNELIIICQIKLFRIIQDQ